MSCGDVEMQLHITYTVLKFDSDSLFLLLPHILQTISCYWETPLALNTQTVVRFEILTMVSLKTQVFWDVTQCHFTTSS